jgi:hypothetical protein
MVDSKTRSVPFEIFSHIRRQKYTNWVFEGYSFDQKIIFFLLVKSFKFLNDLHSILLRHLEVQK